jgi:glycosyltransferase involved in cell wall biosynthesis
VRLYLVEPKAHGLISGGYRYNQLLAEACRSLQLVEVDPNGLQRQLATLAIQAGDWMLADSLFLEPRAFGTFLELKRTRQCRLALVLHAFPSIIERAASLTPEAVAQLTPTATETALVEELDAVICPGPHSARQVKKSMPTARTLLCPPGAPDVAPEQPNFAQQRRRILSVGNVTRAKGYGDGLDAMRQLEDLKPDWEIVGSLKVQATFATELKQRTRTAGLADRVFFRGQLPHADTLRRFQNSDIFLLPSYTETYPLVLLEAQAHGLPVVAYNVHGIPDIVTHGRDGLLATAGDTATLALHLRRLLTNPELWQSHAVAARQAARHRSGWTDLRASLEQL